MAINPTGRITRSQLKNSERSNDEFNGLMRFMGRTRDLGWVRRWDQKLNHVDFIFFSKELSQRRFNVTRGGLPFH